MAFYLNSEEIYDIYISILEKYGNIEDSLNQYDQNGFTPLMNLIKHAKFDNDKKLKGKFNKILEL